MTFFLCDKNSLSMNNTPPRTPAQKWLPAAVLMLLAPIALTFTGALRATLIYGTLMLFLHVVEARKRSQLTDSWRQLFSVNENDARRIMPFMGVCAVPLPAIYLPSWISSWIIVAMLVAAFAAYRPNAADQRSYTAGIQGLVGATRSTTTTTARRPVPRGAISKTN
jgi:hypothetical protein